MPNMDTTETEKLEDTVTGGESTEETKGTTDVEDLGEDVAIKDDDGETE